MNNNRNVSDQLFISREDLCLRWGGVSLSSVKRKEDRGELKRVALFPRRVFYRLADVEAVEARGQEVGTKGGR